MQEESRKEKVRSGSRFSLLPIELESGKGTRRTLYF